KLLFFADFHHFLYLLCTVRAEVIICRSSNTKGSVLFHRLISVYIITAQTSTEFIFDPVIFHCFVIIPFYALLKTRSLITSPAIIRPATPGTKDTLAGTGRPVPLLVSCGSSFFFSVCPRRLPRSLGKGSVEKRTFTFLILRFFSSALITFARGHTLVLEISAI